MQNLRALLGKITDAFWVALFAFIFVAISVSVDAREAETPFKWVQILQEKTGIVPKKDAGAMKLCSLADRQGDFCRTPWPQKASGAMSPQSWGGRQKARKAKTLKTRSKTDKQKYLAERQKRAQLAFENGMSLVKNGDLNAAREHFRIAARLRHKGAVKAICQIVIEYELERNFEEAKAWRELHPRVKALLPRKRERKSELAFRDGMRLIGEKRMDAARKCFRIAAELRNEGAIEVIRQIVCKYELAKDPGEAKKWRALLSPKINASLAEGGDRSVVIGVAGSGSYNWYIDWLKR